MSTGRNPLTGLCENLVMLARHRVRLRHTGIACGSGTLASRTAEGRAGKRRGRVQAQAQAPSSAAPAAMRCWLLHAAAAGQQGAAEERPAAARRQLCILQPGQGLGGSAESTAGQGAAGRRWTQRSAQLAKGWRAVAWWGPACPHAKLCATGSCGLQSAAQRRRRGAQQQSMAEVQVQAAAQRCAWHTQGAHTAPLTDVSSLVLA